VDAVDGGYSDTVGTRGNTPLHHAAFHGHALVAELLLRHGADAGSADGNGNTPLHHAARQGHVTLVAMLLDAGADMREGWRCVGATSIRKKSGGPFAQRRPPSILCCWLVSRCRRLGNDKATCRRQESRRQGNWDLRCEPTNRQACTEGPAV
jgi:hypothetical protein